MALSFGASIKKADLADFFQKASMLLEAGYDITSSCELLAAKSNKKHDKSADGIARVAELLLPDLREGFALSEAMGNYPKYFEAYINQIQVGEAAGKTSDVLARLYDQIKNANKIMQKLKSAMTYPIVVLVMTFAAAGYLFTSVMPDMIGMLSEVGTGELPAMTQLVMDIGDWIKANGIFLITVILGSIIGLVVYSKTIGQMAMARFVTKAPLIGKIIENNSVARYLRNWQQMMLAGAEMSVALKSASDSVDNVYLKAQFMNAYEDYTLNGTAVFETLEKVDALRAMELQTVRVGLETGKIAKVLGILATDREFEAERSVNRLTAAVNPILMAVVGGVVGVLVMAIYGPIISVTDAVM